MNQYQSFKHEEEDLNTSSSLDVVMRKLEKGSANAKLKIIEISKKAHST
jgi:hypothetical protein